MRFQYCCQKFPQLSALGAKTHTLSDGLLVGKCHRRHQEFGFGHRYPMMQDFNSPNSSSERQIQRWLVVSKFSTGFYENVIGGGNDVYRVHPDDGNSDIRAFPPFLHANGFVHWPNKSTKVPKYPLFGIPFSSNLKKGKDIKKDALFNAAIPKSLKQIHQMYQLFCNHFV